MSAEALLVSVHRFNPRPEGYCALVLVGRDTEGPFAALVALTRYAKPIDTTQAHNVVGLACVAHELAAAAIMACGDTIDPMSAVAQVKLTIAASDRTWSISMATAGSFASASGPQVALVRGPSVEVLQRAAGWAVGTAWASLEQAVPA